MAWIEKSRILPTLIIHVSYCQTCGCYYHYLNALVQSRYQGHTDLLRLQRQSKKNCFYNKVDLALLTFKKEKKRKKNRHKISECNLKVFYFTELQTGVHPFLELCYSIRSYASSNKEERKSQKENLLFKCRIFQGLFFYMMKLFQCIFSKKNNSIAIYLLQLEFSL